MARTAAEVIARARAAIGDPEGQRASDPTCLGYVVDAINIVKTARPDLFLGKFAIDYAGAQLIDELPLSDQFFLPVAMFVGAMVESQDEESADRARGAMLSKIGGGMLL
jgi:hypothetical protein